MEKLEQIMHAEEAARLRVAAAKEQSAQIGARAQADAAEAVREARVSVAAKVADLRSSEEVRARAQAGDIESEAAAHLEVELAGARARMATAVDALLQELVAERV